MCEEAFGSNIAELLRDGDRVFFDHGDAEKPEEDYLDSLDRTEFAMAIEDEFEITVPDVIAADWKTLDQIAEYVSTVVSKPLHGGH